jgi:hypothetical protein
MKQNEQQIELKVRIGCNPIYAEVHGCPHKWVTFLNPDWIEGSEEKKWPQAFIKAKGSKGLGEIVKKGRIVKLTGVWKEWRWQDVGRVFQVTAWDEISYQDVKPKPQAVELELAF